MIINRKRMRIRGMERYSGNITVRMIMAIKNVIKPIAVFVRSGNFLFRSLLLSVSSSNLAVDLILWMIF